MTDTGLRRVPVSTYRLQFHRGFTFQDARALVPYLSELGITDCYSSPYLKASYGSGHGYDICDHNQLNPEIGGEADYNAFTDELAAHGMGQIMDVVPNHMAVDPAANGWWRDVLENGRCSRYASFFDIDWDPVKAELKGKVLLPILGDQYGVALERGELRLALVEGAFILRYFAHDLPIDPRSWNHILRHRLDQLQGSPEPAPAAQKDPHVAEYLSIVTALEHLPAQDECDSERITERYREKEIIRTRLRHLLHESPRVRQHVEENLTLINGRPDEPPSFDLLHQVLEAQAYRLAYWRTAAHEINYRRFFEINTLAALAMEQPAVFAATHALIFRLIRERKVTGLRVDHIDGLFDPAEYLERLQQSIDALDTPPVAPAERTRVYTIVEKILAAGESLPPSWLIDGTVGYEFLNEVNGLFVDTPRLRALTRVYRRFTGERTTFREIVYASKKLILLTSLASELNVLAHALNRMSEADRRTRDFTLESLRQALREVVACFPVYRTYVRAEGWSTADRQAIETALWWARRRNPAMEASIFEFLHDVLLPHRDTAAPSLYRQYLQFAMKVQQYTSPVHAKSIEDTAFYRYNLLLSMNEVGSDPQRVGDARAEFHAGNQRRRECWPFGMLASSTHDTKRSEDVRARINALSEMPLDWGEHVSRWARVNAAHRSVVDGEAAPDRNDEYAYYQMLVGAWPLVRQPAGRWEPLGMPDESFIGRMREYMLKAIREAKVHTSWITENQAYETAVLRFVEGTLGGRSSARFLASLLPFQCRIARLGMVNSLAQLVLKMAAPGVTDVYQGNELWEFRLVDPDNRRAVDYDRRRKLLRDLRPLLDEVGGVQLGDRVAAVAEMLEHWEDGRIKLFVTACGLRLRRMYAALFLHGGYSPLKAENESDEHVVALLRQHGTQRLIAAVPRLTASHIRSEHALPVGSETWGDALLHIPAALGASTFRNVFTGETVEAIAAGARIGLPLAQVFRTCPVALLYAG